MCPECGSDDVEIMNFDFGIDDQTGYHDAGIIFRCLKCGAKGDAEDLVPPPRAKPSAVLSVVE